MVNQGVIQNSQQSQNQQETFLGDYNNNNNIEYRSQANRTPRMHNELNCANNYKQSTLNRNCFDSTANTCNNMSEKMVERVLIHYDKNRAVNAITLQLQNNNSFLNTITSQIKKHFITNTNYNMNCVANQSGPNVINPELQVNYDDNLNYFTMQQQQPQQYLNRPYDGNYTEENFSRNISNQTIRNGNLYASTHNRLMFNQMPKSYVGQRSHNNLSINQHKNIDHFPSSVLATGAIQPNFTHNWQFQDQSVVYNQLDSIAANKTRTEIDEHKKHNSKLFIVPITKHVDLIDALKDIADSVKETKLKGKSCEYLFHTSNFDLLSAKLIELVNVPAGQIINGEDFNNGASCEISVCVNTTDKSNINNCNSSVNVITMDVNYPVHITNSEKHNNNENNNVPNSGNSSKNVANIDNDDDDHDLIFQHDKPRQSKTHEDLNNQILQAYSDVNNNICSVSSNLNIIPLVTLVRQSSKDYIEEHDNIIWAESDITHNLTEKINYNIYIKSAMNLKIFLGHYFESNKNSNITVRVPCFKKCKFIEKSFVSASVFLYRLLDFDVIRGDIADNALMYSQSLAKQHQQQQQQQHLQQQQQKVNLNESKESEIYNEQEKEQEKQVQNEEQQHNANKYNSKDVDRCEEHHQSYAKNGNVVKNKRRVHSSSSKQHSCSSVYRKLAYFTFVSSVYDKLLTQHSIPIENTIEKRIINTSMIETLAIECVCNVIKYADEHKLLSAPVKRALGEQFLAEILSESNKVTNLGTTNNEADINPDIACGAIDLIENIIQRSLVKSSEKKKRKLGQRKQVKHITLPNEHTSKNNMSRESSTKKRHKLNEYINDNSNMYNNGINAINELTSNTNNNSQLQYTRHNLNFSNQQQNRQQQLQQQQQRTQTQIQHAQFARGMKIRANSGVHNRSKQFNSSSINNGVRYTGDDIVSTFPMNKNQRNDQVCIPNNSERNKFTDTDFDNYDDESLIILEPETTFQEIHYDMLPNYN